MAEFHFVADYERYVAKLLRDYPLDEAMSHAVGGNYDLIGRIEAELLRGAGLRDGMRLVDLGCGSGRLASALHADADVSYAGIDIVQSLLDYAQSKAPRFEFLLHRGLTIPQPDRSADMVSAFSLFTHLLHAETFIYLQECVRILKPGGRIVFSFLEFAEPAHWDVFVHTAQVTREKRSEHLNMFIERNAIVSWAAKLGLAVERFISADVAVLEGHALGQAVAVLRLPLAPEAAPRVDFLCNVCGHRNLAVPLEHVQNREFQSCAACRSSLRMRTLVHALSTELFGRALILPEFPRDKSIRGLGMSDWEGYARMLETKLDYVNTYYHREPRLDIANVPGRILGRHRFLISSDVFEHIPCFALDRAFANSRALLEKGGAFVFSVPFVKEGETQEHFPRLHDFRIIESRGKRFLYNRTADGEEEVFDQLVFHGGEGMTLEMRMFSEADLLRRLREAGFSSIRLCTDRFPEFGIDWPMDWAVPMVARA